MTYSKIFISYSLSISVEVNWELKFSVYSSQNSWGARGKTTERWEDEYESYVGRWGGANKCDLLIMKFVFTLLGK